MCSIRYILRRHTIMSREIFTLVLTPAPTWWLALFGVKRIFSLVIAKLSRGELRPPDHHVFSSFFMDKHF
eukprot:UN04608